MTTIALRRIVVVATAATAALTLDVGGVAGARTRGSATVASPPKVVRAGRITRRPGTLAPGTRVSSRAVAGQRVFTNAAHGFALATVGQADYPVASVDGGRTWKTDGPALHLHAAQAPLVVAFIGAVNRRKVFAWGGGQVIDTTNDGGRHWYGTLFTDGSPVAVVHDFSGHLLAFVGSFNGSKIWQYVSRDGGRIWRYRGTVAP